MTCSFDKPSRFQQLFFSLEPGFHWQTLLSRYGPEERIIYQYNLSTTGLPWNRRLLQLNRYLLDNTTISGTCGYQRPYYQNIPPISYLFRNPPLSNNVSINEILRLIRECVDHVIFIRVNQPFIDGNHRTAILYLYERLLDCGYILRADPVDLYARLSHRDCPQMCGLVNEHHCSRTQQSLVKWIRRRIRREMNIRTDHLRIQVAEEVKTLARWNTVFTDLEDLFYRVTTRNIQESRSAYRYFKRREPKRFHQFRLLHRDLRLRP